MVARFIIMVIMELIIMIGQDAQLAAIFLFLAILKYGTTAVASRKIFFMMILMVVLKSK